ncbi:hypothetical protein NDA10_006671 [Ustilago hordei]|nr:hypothetical protein NDA10_006671 [Ustilago hordei]UTT97012.1 hypothetical protein NDA17_005038 [Ustilago hordei]
MLVMATPATQLDCTATLQLQRAEISTTSTIHSPAFVSRLNMALPTSRTASNMRWQNTLRHQKIYLKLKCWRPCQGWKHISRLLKMQGYNEGKTSSNTNRNRLLPWRACLKTESRSSGRRKHWI